MRKKTLLLIIAAALSMFVYPQDIKKLQETFLEAEYFLLTGEYQDALPIYLSLYEKMPGNSNIAYRIGSCYLNIPGKKNLAIDFLETASRNLSANIKEGSVSQKEAPYEALADLGKAYRINYMFDKAKECYQKYYETLLEDDLVNRDFISNEISVCETARLLISSPVAFTEENIGDPFNTEESEFNPVISADGKSFAYMTSKKFYNAVMFSRLVSNKWITPVNITPELLIDSDFYISSLSSDGKTIYLSMDDNYSSDIYMSTYDGSKWTKSISLNKNINTKYWESHGFISADGNQLVFASDRPGGLGGLDLYISQKVKGDWSEPVNLGPEINTVFNEDRPFLTNDGKTMFFSSQGHKNIGGYDIFRSELQLNKLWSNPVNLGYPVNNPDDNFFFVPIGKGNAGYYTIFKEFPGKGNEDIYIITFREK